MFHSRRITTSTTGESVTTICPLAAADDGRIRAGAPERDRDKASEAGKLLLAVVAVRTDGLPGRPCSCRADVPRCRDEAPDDRVVDAKNER